MKIIIMGAGNGGVRIARQLIDENKNAVLIDRDAEKVKLAMNSLDCMMIHGEADAPETLIEAGIEDADFFIGVTESDELNMIACGMVSSEFSVPYKIAWAIVRSVRHGPTRNYACMPAYVKWFLSFIMALGRMELYTILVLFTRRFWAR